MRVKVPRPVRTFLEMDELVALTDAAAEQDARQANGLSDGQGDRNGTAAAVAGCWARGMRPSDIAAELGLSRPRSATTCAGLAPKGQRPTSAVEPSWRRSAGPGRA